MVWAVPFRVSCRHLRWGIANSAGSIETLRPLWAESQGMKEHTSCSPTSSQSLQQFEVRSMPSMDGPIISEQGRGRNGWRQSRGGWVEENLGWSFCRGGVLRLGRWTAAIGSSTAVLSLAPMPPRTRTYTCSHSFLFSLNIRPGTGHHTLKMLDHCTTVVDLICSMGPVTLFQLPLFALHPFAGEVVVPLTLSLIILFHLAVAGLVWGGTRAVLSLPEHLHPPPRLRRTAFSIRLVQSLSVVLWLAGSSVWEGFLPFVVCLGPAFQWLCPCGAWSKDNSADLGCSVT